MILIELTFDEFKEKMKTSDLIEDCIRRSNIASITRVAIIVLSDQLSNFDQQTLQEHNLISDFANKSTGAATNTVVRGFDYKDISASDLLKECKKIRDKCKSKTIKELMDLLIASKKGKIKKMYQNLKEYFEENRIEGTKVMTQKAIIIKTVINDLVDKENTKQIILTGAPGTGKTYNVKKFLDHNKFSYEFIQFHSSYDYSDFVEGLRPVQVEETNNTTFVRLDGNFKAFCRKIVEENQPDKKYFFVIDEINRADLSRVFGELMFGLEEDYRGSSNAFKTQYHNLPTYSVEKGMAKKLEKDCFEKGFYIPENLYIIGTMNDIDRSVEAFDFALRRRFRWIEVRANESMEDMFKEMDGKDNGPRMQIMHRVKAMNNVIAEQTQLGLSDPYQIGGAYFKLYDGSNLDIIWSTRVEPLLREYCRGRNKKDVNDFIQQCENKLFDKDNLGDA